MPDLTVGVHKAEAHPEFAADAASTCVVCHRGIRKVPGGRGPTWVHDDGYVTAPGSPPEPAETAIVITVPDTDGIQVLIRLPGHLNKDTVAVDFRPHHQASWTPSDFFPNSVGVHHQ